MKKIHLLSRFGIKELGLFLEKNAKRFVPAASVAELLPFHANIRGRGHPYRRIVVTGPPPRNETTF
jgi:hypothetical protein